MRAQEVSREAIVRVGETAPDALREKAVYVRGVMEARLEGLGVGWADVTSVAVYCAHRVDGLVEEVVLPRMGRVSIHGVRRFHARPPVVGIEYEMDVRGVRTEEVLD